MFENVDGRTDDGQTTDAGVIGKLIAHFGAFGSGELKIKQLITDLDKQKFECKILNIFLPIRLIISFGCTKEPSH